MNKYSNKIVMRSLQKLLKWYKEDIYPEEQTEEELIKMFRNILHRCRNGVI